MPAVSPARRSGRPTTRWRAWNGRTPWRGAVAQLREFKGEEIAIIASARMTNEELYLTRRLADGLKCSLIDVVPRPGEADGILLSADRNPNTAGAKLLRVAADAPGTRLKEIIDGVNAKRIHALICLGEDAAEHGADPRALEDLPCLIATSILPNATTARPRSSCPGAGSRKSAAR